MAISAPMSGTVNGVRVLLVEDDPLVREILASALTGAGFDVAAEADGTRVDRVAATFRPDIALLDIHLGDGVDGFTVARRLRAHGDIPFVFLTGASDLDQVLSGFELGGDDYVVKPFLMPELLARIRAVLRRFGRMGRTVIEVGDLIVDLDAHQVVRSGHTIEVTHREFCLLAALARHAGIVMSKAQLLTEVWGFEHYDINVVEVHISALRRKLDEHGPRLLHTVRGVGYVLRVS